MKTKYRILHIITGLGVGGAERELFNLVSSKPHNDFKSYILSIGKCQKSHYYNLLNTQGFEIQSLNVEGLLSFLKSLLSLYRIVRKINPNLIQGWMYHGNIVALISKYINKSPPILLWNIRTALDDPRSLTNSTRFINFVLSKFSFIPDKIIFNSSRSIHHHSLIGYSNKNSTLIYNGFDSSKWMPSVQLKTKVRLELGLSPYTFCFVYVGRNHQQKNLPLLFSAFEKASHLVDDIALICIGAQLDIDYSPTVNTNVIFLGQRKDVERLIPAFDALCLTSLWEGLPNVVGEAMLSGLPCLVSDVGDSKYIVGACGWVVPSNDEEGYLEAMIEASRMSSEDFTTLKILARKRVIENFSNELKLDKYSSLYLSFLEAR